MSLVFDGVVNQYGNGIGAVIITPQGTHIPFTARLTFKCTNNKAEYEACIMDWKNVLILGSSILMYMVIRPLLLIKLRVNGKGISLASSHTEIMRGGFQRSLLRLTSIIFLEMRIRWQMLLLRLLR